MKACNCEVKENVVMISKNTRNQRDKTFQKENFHPLAKLKSKFKKTVKLLCHSNVHSPSHLPRVFDSKAMSILYIYSVHHMHCSLCKM